MVKLKIHWDDITAVNRWLLQIAQLLQNVIFLIFPPWKLVNTAHTSAIRILVQPGSQLNNYTTLLFQLSMQLL